MANDIGGKEPEVPIKEKEPQRSIKTLMVEDDVAIVSLLRQVFEMSGFKIADADITDNVPDALKRLEEAKRKGESYDFVFSDLGLVNDKEGGYKIAQAVKDEQLAEYFTLFTGSAVFVKQKYPTSEKLKEVGIDNLIGKPVSVKDLREGLRQAKEAITNPPSSLAQ
ncbi:MAG: response regulator [Candidatus Levybacteria bacterium]|nr:response regulator [Candidatus Levybacteria bacterium]